MKTKTQHTKQSGDGAKRHTPTPCTYEPTMDDFLLFDEDGKQFAKVWDEDTARCILRAVNSHEALLAVIKSAKQVLSNDERYFALVKIMDEAIKGEIKCELNTTLTK